MTTFKHSRRRARRTPFALAALAALASHLGCSDGDTRSTQEPATTCRADALEADFEAAPFVGPGVDQETGALRAPAAGESYVVSSTYGVPKPDPASLERWGQLMAAIQVQLAAQPGLLALRLGSSSTCGSGRTLAVWSSEEAMYEFVTSPAHAEAMVAAPEVVQPGFGTTHWTERDPHRITFEQGVQRLRRAGD
jgi:heme-degrading monooxygenase HmoA